MEVGFLGLGNMGAGMAANLFDDGHEITVNNRTPSRAQLLIDLGAHLAARVKDVCQGDAVITMLALDEAVEEIVFGEGAAANHPDV